MKGTFIVEFFELKNTSSPEIFSSKILQHILKNIDQHKLNNKLSINGECNNKNIQVSLEKVLTINGEIEKTNLFFYCTIDNEIVYPFEKVMRYYNNAFNQDILVAMVIYLDVDFFKK